MTCNAIWMTPLTQYLTAFRPYEMLARQICRTFEASTEDGHSKCKALVLIMLLLLLLLPI